MRILRNPRINALLISIVSVFYTILFIFTSNHVEFMRLLSSSKTLNSDFWNGWSVFIQNGNMKYIGYVIIALTLVIIVLTTLRKQKYDEYQVNILEKGLITAGIITVFMLPMALLLVLSDGNYVIESLFLLLTIQWLGVLATDLIYTAKYFKS